MSAQSVDEHIINVHYLLLLLRRADAQCLSLKHCSCVTETDKAEFSLQEQLNEPQAAGQLLIIIMGF